MRAATAAAAGASARYSWKLSRMHWVKASGSGISSRQEVGETISLPSQRLSAITSPMPSATGSRAEK